MLPEHAGGSTMGQWLAPIQLSCSVPGVEAGFSNFCAHQNHQDTYSKHRFLGPTPAILVQNMMGDLEICMCAKGSS